MFTTEDENAHGAGEEPPFLQEPTVYVDRMSGRSWQDRFSDFMDYQRPPLMLLMAAALIAIGVILYVQRPGLQEDVDPLADAGTPLAVAVASDSDDAADTTIISPTPATVGPFIGLSDRTTTTVAAPATVRRTVTTAAQTTAAPTTAPTTLETTTEPPTTEPPTTEPPTTEPPTTEPPTTEPPTTVETTAPPTTVSEPCQARIRRSDVFAGPTEESEELGRASRGTYPILAFTQENGGWVQLQFSDGAGWVEANRIRGLEGDCN